MSALFLFGFRMTEALALPSEPAHEQQERIQDGTDPSADRTGQTRLRLLVVITLILAGWALHMTGTARIPVVFSIFLALLVAPLDRWVAEKVPEKVSWLGHVAAMGTVLVTLLIFLGLIWIAAQQVVERFLLPEFGEETRGASSGPTGDDVDGSSATMTSESAARGASSAAGTPSTGGGFFDRFRAVLTGTGGSFLGNVGDWASGIARQTPGAAGATLGAAALVFFLTLIMLIEAPKWQQKVASILAGPARQAAMETVGIISHRLRQYLTARTILGVFTAALYGTWLWFFNVGLLVTWMLVAFLLNYIPTFGSLIAGILPVAYAFVQKDLGTAVAVGAGIFVIEQVMGNYVDPRVQGRQVSLSSLVVLATLLLWGWIWGVAGAILAVRLPSPR